LRKIREDARALWDERAVGHHADLPRLHRFAHFWLMVWRSFTRNRCPVRASALAYATLLALIPMLAVVVSITSSLLKKEGEEGIDQFIAKMVASVVPSAEVNTNTVSSDKSREEAVQSPESKVQSQEPASSIQHPVASIPGPSTLDSSTP